jgi:hypothetical protein
MRSMTGWWEAARGEGVARKRRGGWSLPAKATRYCRNTEFDPLRDRGSYTLAARAAF